MRNVQPLDADDAVGVQPDGVRLVPVVALEDEQALGIDVDDAVDDQLSCADFTLGDGIHHHVTDLVAVGRSHGDDVAGDVVGLHRRALDDHVGGVAAELGGQ